MCHHSDLIWHGALKQTWHFIAIEPYNLAKVFADSGGWKCTVHYVYRARSEHGHLYANLLMKHSLKPSLLRTGSVCPRLKNIKGNEGDVWQSADSSRQGLNLNGHRQSLNDFRFT